MRGITATGTTVTPLGVWGIISMRAKAYKVFRCWVSEYEALSELTAHENSVVLERLVPQHEGWERDIDVSEPAET